MILMFGRRMVLVLCRLLGAGVRILRKPVVIALELLLLSVAVLWLAEWLADLLWLETRPQWLGVGSVGFVWGLVLLAWRIALARRRLVIEKFEDHTGGEAVEAVTGLSVLLSVELARINRLFDALEDDDQLPAADDGLASFGAAIEGGGVNDLLQNSVSAESTLSLGPFAIPVGMILGIFGRIVQGPRLIGHIHSDGDRRTITLQLTRDGRAWRYQDTAAVAEDGARRWPRTDTLVTDLACRILVDQAVCATSQHQAFRHLVSALRAYRTGVQIGRQRAMNLRRAEHQLSAAVAVDRNFDLAFYNLGVVYTQLDQLDAAGVAFRRSIALNNLRWSAYYAVARNHYQRAVGDETSRATAEILLLKAVDFCDRAYALAPGAHARAQVLIQKAVALFHYCVLLDSAQMCHDAVQTAKRAASKSWWALCLAELGSPRPARRARARRFASDCMQSFARMVMIGVEASKRLDLKRSRLQMWWLQQTAVSYLEMARYLVPGDASVCQDLGKAYLELRRFDRAAAEFGRAGRLDPASIQHLGLLAVSQAECHRINDVRDTYRRVLEHLASIPPETLANMVHALQVIEAKYDEIHGLLAEARGLKQRKHNLWPRARILPRLLQAIHRLAGGRLALFSHYSGRLTPLIGDAEAADRWLADQKQPIRDMAARLSAQAEFRAELAAATSEPVDLAGLDQLLTAKEAAGFAWEAGEVAMRLAEVKYQQGDLDGAQEVLRRSIAFFEQGNRSELARQGLYSRLAAYLRRTGRVDEAIEMARKALQLDPVGHYERNELAWCHFARQEYAQAIAAWEEALLWSPDAASIYFSMSAAWMHRHDLAGDAAERRRCADAAIAALETVVELQERDTAQQNTTRYHLANSLGEAGRFRDAARLYRSLQASGFYPTIMTYKLADTYLQLEQHHLAAECFGQILTEMQPRLDGGEAGEEVPAPSGEVYTVAVLVVFGHLGEAYTRLQMELPLEASFASMRAARQALARITDAATREGWRATCDRIEGSLLFKADRLEEAVAALERSLASAADSEAHYLLAAALRRQIARTGDAADVTVPLRRARHHLEQARRLDHHGALTGELKDLAEELAGITPVVQAGAPVPPPGEAEGQA